MYIEYTCCSQCKETEIVVVLQDRRVDKDGNCYDSDELTMCEGCLEKSLKMIRERQDRGV